MPPPPRRHRAARGAHDRACARARDREASARGLRAATEPRARRRVVPAPAQRLRSALRQIQELRQPLQPTHRAHDRAHPAPAQPRRRRCSAGAKSGSAARTFVIPGRGGGEIALLMRTHRSVPQRGELVGGQRARGLGRRVPHATRAAPPQAHRRWRTCARPAVPDEPAFPWQTPNSRAPDARRGRSR